MSMGAIQQLNQSGRCERLAFCVHLMVICEGITSQQQAISAVFRMCQHEPMPIQEATAAEPLSHIWANLTALPRDCTDCTAKHQRKRDRQREKDRHLTCCSSNWAQDPKALGFKLFTVVCT